MIVFVFVAATNNIQALDPALLRSGRFDRIVQFKLPNREARVRLLMYSPSEIDDASAHLTSF